MKPGTCDRNLTPTSTGCGSAALATVGASLGVQMLHGQLNEAAMTLTVFPAAGVSRLPLSSTARLLMTVGPRMPGRQTYVHAVRPVAACHVAPPSVETSTAVTLPPTSVAVPLI